MDLKTRYRQTFAHMKAPPQLETEVLNLTEQNRGPKKFIARRLAVAAMAAALMGALAVGANAATGGALGEMVTIALLGEDGELVRELTYGGKIEGDAQKGEPITLEIDSQQPAE